MTELTCPYCSSDNVYYSKKRACFVCEDCEENFTQEEVSEDTKSQKLFFSYGHDENVPLVLRLKRDLEARGHQIWFDKSNIKAGDDWREDITHGLLEASEVLSFLSKHSVRQPGVCLDEIRIALCEKSNAIQTILLEKEDEVVPPATLSNIQWLDMSDWKDKAKEGEAAFETWYSKKFDELCYVVESADLVDFSGEIAQLKNILSPNLSDTKEQYLLQQPFFGREWLKKEISDWCANEQGHRAYVIIGGPGFGKSSFAAHMLHFEPIAICGLFCEWDKNYTVDSNTVIKTLAYKLAAKLPDYRKILLSTLSIGDAAASINALKPSELFDRLLTSPLNNLIDGHRPTYLILIDALDEASVSGKNTLAHVLAENLHKLPRWLRFVLTARPESDIISVFSAYDVNVIETEHRLNSADIRGYLATRLKEELVNSKTQLDLLNELTDKCQGSFLYASMLVDNIEKGNYVISEIASLPIGIDAFYYRDFERKFATESYDETRQALELIIAAQVIPSDLLAMALSMDQYKYLKFRETLGSLLNARHIHVSSERKTLEGVAFCHKSIMDWLTDYHKSASFYIDKQRGCVTLAHFCKDVFEENIRTDNVMLCDFVEQHICEYLANAALWNELEEFLITHPKYDLFWRILDRFPGFWDFTKLILAFRSDPNNIDFLKKMQRCGERTFLRFLLDKIVAVVGFDNIDLSTMQIYIDITHLGGEYQYAVELCEKYLQKFSDEEILNDREKLFLLIRKIHHSMFYAPVKGLINEALALVDRIDQEVFSKEYNELLFLIGGNLGVLSGNYTFAREWTEKSLEFSETKGLNDFKQRAVRKKADLLISSGEIDSALHLITQYVSLDREPESRYQIYLLSSLGECYRIQKDFDAAYNCFKKMLKYAQQYGIPGWVAHAYLGLSNLFADFAFYHDATEYLQKAKEIYQAIDQKWGLINAELVGYKIEGDYKALEVIEETVEHLQYAHESRQICVIRRGDDVVDSNLMFL